MSEDRESTYVLDPVTLAAAHVCACRDGGTDLVSRVDDLVDAVRNASKAEHELEINRLVDEHELAIAGVRAELAPVDPPQSGRRVSTPLTEEQRVRVKEEIATAVHSSENRLKTGEADRIARIVGCSKSQVQSVMYGKVA